MPGDRYETEPERAKRPNGLCDSCLHQRVVENTRGSRFSLCERSRTDDAYPKYPRTPVLECRGWEPTDASG